MPNWLTTKVLSWIGRAATEGQWRPGPYLLSSGWLPNGSPWNYWQTGLPQGGLPYGNRSAMVEACVSAYSQTVPMCPGDHWRRLDNGGRERVTNSALSRIMRRPNDYQSISDFLLNLTRRLYERGEAFAVAIRNNRAEIAELHLMRLGTPQIAEEGSIFYSLSGNEVIERRFDLALPVPARDVLHVRLHTPRHPLKGESPILAAALEMAMSGAAMSQQVAFYINQARPSFTLETDEPLKREQAQELRAWWDEYTQGENAGKSPILTHGLKAHPVTTNAVDAQLAEMLKKSDESIALAFRVPLQIFGLGGNTYSSTELLMQSWIASGLGFTLNHIEEAFGLLFGLKGVPDEYLELDTRALLRSAYRERIEALARGVISGIYSPDEARASEDLPKVAGGHGDMPRVQQQVVPLSYGSDLQPPSPNAAPTPPPPDPTPPPDDGSGDAAGKLASFRAAYDRERLVA
jgi:HK97 family phage portal protein